MRKHTVCCRWHYGITMCFDVRMNACELSPELPAHKVGDIIEQIAELDRAITILQPSMRAHVNIVFPPALLRAHCNIGKLWLKKSVGILVEDVETL